MESYEEAYTFSGFEAMCEEESGNTALYYLGERYSYGRLAMLIDRFAAGLVKIGVKPRIASCSTSRTALNGSSPILP